MNILLSERCRDIFFGQLIGKTLNHIRGDAGLCYAPPLQSVKARISGNTYSSGSQSRGNTSNLRGVNDSINTIFQSPLFYSSSPSDGSLMPSPTPYTNQSHGCYAEDLVEELNCGGEL